MEEEKKNEISVPLPAVVEAVLFTNNEPLSLKKLVELCGASSREIKDALAVLKENLNNKDRGLLLLETPGGYQLGTKPETALYVEKLFEDESSSSPLSQAALETLAIIACKQPVTRLEIENIRGVKGDTALEKLLQRGLIKIDGRKEGLGRPFLYGTTGEFLRYFGLQSLKEVKELEKELPTSAGSLLPAEG